MLFKLVEIAAKFQKKYGPKGEEKLLEALNICEANLVANDSLSIIINAVEKIYDCSISNEFFTSLSRDHSECKLMFFALVFYSYSELSDTQIAKQLSNYANLSRQYVYSYRQKVNSLSEDFSQDKKILNKKNQIIKDYEL